MMAARALISFVACLAAANAFAQAYPTKPVRILVPTPAGGPGDIVARAVAQSLQQALAQPVIVENRVGADSIIAVDACAHAAPDGYMLCSVDSFAITLNPVARARLPYDPEKDLSPVIQYGTMGSALSVHPSVPAKSLRELLDLAKAKPDTIAFGTYGQASANHLYVEWFKNAMGIRFLDVPYKAASQAMQALLTGEVSVIAYSLGQSLPQARAGKLRILAVAGDERSPSVPDVASFREAGMEVSIRAWFGLFAPAATPRPVVQRLNAELASVIPTAAFKDKFLTPLGIELSAPAAGSTDAFAAYLKRERAMYADLVKVVGLKLE